MMLTMTDLGIPEVGEGTLVASGGSALVYRAQDRQGKTVAVKVLRGIKGTEVARRFERELSAAERLSGHPRIIQILSTGVTPAGEPYLVMPFVEGGSLDDELERHGRFSLSDATRDVAVAAEALQFAHAQGVLHRDIKPANLLRAADGSVLVSDFGVARVVDAGISSATIGASTPLYAAPELLSDNAASVRSEVYGLAALLYALLQGRPAFADSENIWATINRVRTERPPDIDGVPAPVMAVIRQGMAKDPADRPASALAFVENLRTALTAPPDWVPPPSTAELAADGDVLLGPSRHSDEPLGGIVAPAVTPERPNPAPPITRPASHPPAASSAAVTAPEPPPVPAYGRRLRPVGERPRRGSSALKFVAATVALALVAAASWWTTSQLLDDNDPSERSADPPVDNSLPSTDDDASGTGGDTGDTGDTEDMTIDDLPTSSAIPDTFVSFAGDHYSALLPEGWTLSARDVEESYGFRSQFVNGDMYLNIDTTPKEQREPGGDIVQSAREIAAGIGSASEVRTEVVEGLAMHSFTFRNNRGVASIDIFFEVDGDGYAVVAGSASDPDTAFATARLVALSVRSNPS